MVVSGASEKWSKQNLETIEAQTKIKMKLIAVRRRTGQHYSGHSEHVDGTTRHGMILTTVHSLSTVQRRRPKGEN